MTEKAPCIRCSRNIDAWAKICPFCNWDQSVAPPAYEPPKPAAVTDYRPPEEFDLKKKAMFAGAGVLALVAAFGVGMIINRDGAPKSAPKTVEEQVEEEQQARRTPSTMRADTPLVPVNEPGGIEQPITSAPVTPAPGAEPNDWQRTDATAVSATEYAEMAKRAQAEKKLAAQAVDPRSLTGPAYAQAPPLPRRPSPSSQQAGAPGAVAAQRGGPIRTRPVPQSQPLPHISGAGTARLSLTIGADGRVKNINIERALRRNNAQLISAVQSWRFKPATVNGHPVAAPYSVEISFKE
ncbi:MAG TPA: TonB family protein [Thermoanaerobaculia bacterium]|nr:TonB family protein [Thermoanaerobaculia bacterium]